MTSVETLTHEDIPIHGTNAASLASAAFFFGPRRPLFSPRPSKFVYQLPNQLVEQGENNA
ncbi:hypothetical protein [Bradyrhizobium sp. UFLA05-109]